MRYFLYVFFLFFYSIIDAQNNELLCVINGEKISVNQFKRIYEKNRDLIDSISFQSPDEYLELFIDYKLKVQEAYALGYAESKIYKSDLKKYRDQLAQNHIKDTQVTEKLVKEAYDRSCTEVNARHILVRHQSGVDTLETYSKIKKARERILAGEDFTTVAKEISEDPSVKTNGGELGWFGAFKMVYPFENAAFETKVGDVSKPFKTQFGYHIVQTTDVRKFSGTVQVAHILITHQQKDSTVNAAHKIQEIYGLLKNGSSFESLVNTYSNDRSTAAKGGKLNTFQKGQLRSSIFEDVAFGLEKSGDVSAPFKTDFGWHIVKLIKKNPVGTYQEMKRELTQKVTRDKRSQVIDKTLRTKLRQKYHISNIDLIINRFAVDYSSVNNGIEQFKKDKEKIAFKVKDKVYLYNDINNHLKSKSGKKFQQQYSSKLDFVSNVINAYVDEQIKAYHLEHLEEEEPAFNEILLDYKEGLLLFELLENRIWKVATTDTLGLQSYFETHKKKYESEEKLILNRYTSSSKKALKKVRKSVLKNKNLETNIVIEDPAINSELDITILSSNIEQQVVLNIGVTDILNTGDNYIFYFIKNIIPEQEQDLSIVRGRVMSDFQKALETSFVDNLKSKATIDIKTAALATLVEYYKKNE